MQIDHADRVRDSVEGIPKALAKRSDRREVAPCRLTAMAMVLGFVVAGQAANLFTFTSTLGRGQAVLNDAGRLTITGKCFQNVSVGPTGTFPSFAPLSFVFADNSMAHVDGFIFLRGTLYQNQTSFPGSYQYANASGQVVASLSDNGNLYLKSTLVTGSGCTSPPWEPDLWNNDLQILQKNNCYNYANNQITYTFAFPGRASGQGDRWTDPYTVDLIRTKALSDGLTWVGWDYPGPSYVCPGGGHLVFMCVDVNGWDYHWYRRDSNGLWSHKMSTDLAANRDASSNLISNPLTANRRYQEPPVDYSQNGGFYCTCGNNANVR